MLDKSVLDTKTNSQSFQRIWIIIWRVEKFLDGRQCSSVQVDNYVRGVQQVTWHCEIFLQNKRTCPGLHGFVYVQWLPSVAVRHDKLIYLNDKDS